MRTAMKILQKELPEPIAIGIGVNTGEAVVGNMGSDTRFDYSAIGDAVNTAARLESATKEAGVDILIGERTAMKVDQAWIHSTCSVNTLFIISVTSSGSNFSDRFVNPLTSVKRNVHVRFSPPSFSKLGLFCKRATCLGSK